MSFNNGNERRKLNAKWEQLRVQYREAGMSEEAIQAMYEFDLGVLNSERAYDASTVAVCDGEDDVDARKAADLKQYEAAITVTDTYHETKSRFGWIGEIENERLLAALESLSELDLKILTLYVYAGYTESEIASALESKRITIHGLPLLRPDLAPDVQSVGFVYHVPQRDDDTGMGIFRVGGIEVFIDRNKADAADAEILLDVVAGVDGVSPQTGEVFDNHAVDMTGFNIREHLLKARTVEVCPGRAVVDVGIVHADLRVLLQIAGNNHLLGFNGYAVRVGILHRKADVDRGAASGVGLLHGYRSRFFPAFSRHAQPTFLCS